MTKKRFRLAVDDGAIVEAIGIQGLALESLQVASNEEELARIARQVILNLQAARERLTSGMAYAMAKMALSAAWVAEGFDTARAWLTDVLGEGRKSAISNYAFLGDTLVPALTRAQVVFGPQEPIAGYLEGVVLHWAKVAEAIPTLRALIEKREDPQTGEALTEEEALGQMLQLLALIFEFPSRDDVRAAFRSSRRPKPPAGVGHDVVVIVLPSGEDAREQVINKLGRIANIGDLVVEEREGDRGQWTVMVYPV